ncbi:MAG: site-specific integrase [Marinifilaceae bacterium]|jgi:site-specific recombinase XerD|nr:site-specific integrase [Marinifilaceae bacterium]
MDNNIIKYIELLRLQRYSENSIRNYVSAVSRFREYAKNQNQNQLDFNTVKNYLYSIIKQKKLGYSSQRLILSAVSKYSELVYSKELDLTNLYPKRKQKPLPNYLSQLQIRAMIENTHNIKHKLIIACLYSSGLRLSELLNLELKHINTTTKKIKIVSSKNNKDRYVILAENLLIILNTYLTQFSPQKFLIESRTKGKYSESSVQAIVKKAAQKAGIIAKVTPHTLRHSYATHMLESGTDIRVIQELLGHSSVRTTEIYTHISKKIKDKIRSPFDDF